MPVAVVTGSASGIGQATAIALATRGYDIVLHTRRNLAGLQQTARELAGMGRRVLCITADISDPLACRDLVSAAWHWQGRIDAWINNAGADVLTGSLAEASFEKRLGTLLATDVMGTIQLSRQVAPLMAEQRQGHNQNPIAAIPSLINIGWDQAQTGMEGEAGQLFCTSKAAVEAFTRALAITHAPNLRVNVVAPGWIKTKWGDSASIYWDHRARSESLLHRWGRPSDVASTIAWLCSSEAEFINAQVIPVNGGFRPSSASQE